MTWHDLCCCRLNNLFNNLDDGSRNRAVVLTSMVRLAGQTDLLSMVPTDVEKVSHS